MNWQALVVAVIALKAMSLDAAEKEPLPQWIWTGNAATEAAPVGPAYGRVTFDLADPESGRVELTADNQYELHVNGRRVGAGDVWQKLDGYDVSSLLAKGRNVVAVKAVNTDGPGGMVARVIVKSRSGETAWHSTGPAWKTSSDAPAGWSRPEFNDASWAAPHVFGALGAVAPWGENVKLAPADSPPQFTALPRPPGPFQLLDGDRVLFVGDALIERAQASDFIETRLTCRYCNRNIIFRNLGWSGDTVFGDARAGFGVATDGFRQLQQQVYALRPTVIILGYGGVESFAGAAGLPRFLKGLETLLNMLETTRAQFVFVSPIRQENLGRPLPDPAAHNRQLQLYVDALRQIAAERNAPFIDLFQLLDDDRHDAASLPLTENGIHLTDFGYRRAALAIERGLGLKEQDWHVAIDGPGQTARCLGTTVSDLKQSDGKIRFQAVDDALPLPAATLSQRDAHMLSRAPERNHDRRFLSVAGLPAGKYALQIDGKMVAAGSAGAWAAGVTWASGPEFDQAEQLRQAIVAKNQLYFYRWRPQNETYLLGFRKHEQGQNAREIPMFDPLVEERETVISNLRSPRPHQYELAPAAGL